MTPEPPEPPRPADPTGPARFAVYLRERFPLHAHGPLIAAFAFCAVSVSSVLRQRAADPAAPLAWTQFPGAAAVGVAFVVCLAMFLQLRIADEFKDAEEDAAFRPDRPVPRGLVTLRELGAGFVLAGAAQLAAAVWLDARLGWLLLVAWAYLALMSREFFAGRFLRGRPVLYLLSHMGIMPLVDLFAAGCDWVPAEGGPPPGLGPFLLASFCNGVVIEVGRKLRVPAAERPGVPTYSALWGRRGGLLAWGLALAATAAAAIWTAALLGVPWVVAGALTAVGAAILAAGRAYLRSEEPAAGKRLELLSGVWTLALYLSLGLGPWAVAWLGG